MAPVRRFAVLGALYFSQGLPFGFFSHAVPVLLNRSHPPELVGLSSLLALPWALKFLWAPWVDRVGGGRHGRRRVVILPLQALSVLALIALAFSGASDQNLKPLLYGFFLVSVLSATQDIATDALSIDLLRSDEHGRGGAVQSGAYRAGMIAGGGGILALIDYLGVREAFLLMAALVAACSMPLLRFQEPAAAQAAAVTAAPGALSLLKTFFQRKDAATTLLLLLAFKLGDALAAGMVTRWFVRQGLSNSFIATSRGLVGGLTAIVGAALGAWLLHLLGSRRALPLVAGLQGLAVLAYAVLDFQHPSLVGPVPMAASVYYAASAVEHLFGGAATAVLFAHMMAGCRDEARGTDFTVQACLLVMVTGLGLVGSGFVAGRFGVSGLLHAASVLGLLSPLLVALLLRTGQGTPGALARPAP